MSYLNSFLSASPEAGVGGRLQCNAFCRSSAHSAAVILLTAVILFSSCGREPLAEVNFEEEEFAEFVEPDFPFITTSLDATNLGADFPADNIAPRCIAIRFGNEAYTCFDPDLLRWAVAWTGEFLPMVTMAQVSYRDFNNKNNLIPRISGEPKLATGHYPGWREGSGPEFRDPRPTAPNPVDYPSGAMPEEIGRWSGLYQAGDSVILSYEVGSTPVREKPGSLRSGDQTAFTRTIRVGASAETLSMVAAEVVGGGRIELTGQAVFFHHGSGEAFVTAAGIAGDAGNVELRIVDDRYFSVIIPPREEDLTFTLVLWKGQSEDFELFGRMLLEYAMIPDFRRGGDRRWKETVRTRGTVAPDTTAWVTDRLTLPIPNPWQRNVRVVDVAFFDNGDAGLVTFEGDVWIVEGIDDRLRSLRWRRFASGLYETQSIGIVDGQIYTYGKEGIVRFHDLNGNGEADYYENFSNRIDQSIESREWASDMVTAPRGGFYVAKGAALDMGPHGFTERVTPGIRGGSHHSGSILHVSADGRTVRRVASGFRGPYLGIHPETGVLTASDQEGHFVPSTPILLVSEGDYYGVPATAHRDPVPDITPPLMWIPRNVDRSSISQVWVTSDRMGPLSGRLVHFSYGRPGLFKIHFDSTGSEVQGGVSVIPATYPAPTMKGAMGPRDGRLYITGFNLWDSNSAGYSAFTRLRYTGLPDYLPESFRVRREGIVLHFGVELDEASATDPASFRVSRWNYLRSEQYGSGNFRLDGSPGQELLPVFSAHLSDDRRSVFLAVPNIQEVMQMEVSWQFRAGDGDRMHDAIWFTVNGLDGIDLVAEGFSGLDPEELLVTAEPQAVSAEETEETASAEQGQVLFMRIGCAGCHATGENVGGGLMAPPCTV